VPFCAPTCMFSTKGKFHTQKNRGHDRPLRADSTGLMAESGEIRNQGIGNKGQRSGNKISID
jgi:hypothetical protein